MNAPNFTMLGSRTNWTIIAMFVIGGGNAIVPVLPPTLQALALAALSALAMYFHVNPSQTYNGSSAVMVD